jgi:hypothetical protein
VPYAKGDEWVLTFRPHAGYTWGEEEKNDAVRAITDWVMYDKTIAAFFPPSKLYDRGGPYFQSRVSWFADGSRLNLTDATIGGVRYDVTAAPYSEEKLGQPDLTQPLPSTTTTVQLDFSSDRPVTPQQFFTLVSAIQTELVPAESTVSIMPLTETTFRGVFKVPSSIAPDLIVGDSEEIQGVNFTLTGVSLLDDTGAAPAPAPASIVAEEKKLSTGAVLGIGAAVVAVGGGTVYYLSTRKKRRRRKAA